MMEISFEFDKFPMKENIIGKHKKLTPLGFGKRTGKWLEMDSH
jgi:hypothetical protein